MRDARSFARSDERARGRARAELTGRAFPTVAGPESGSVCKRAGQLDGGLEGKSAGKSSLPAWLCASLSRRRAVGRHSRFLLAACVLLARLSVWKSKESSLVAIDRHFVGTSLAAAATHAHAFEINFAWDRSYWKISFGSSLARTGHLPCHGAVPRVRRIPIVLLHESPTPPLTAPCWSPFFADPADPSTQTGPMRRGGPWHPSGPII